MVSTGVEILQQAVAEMKYRKERKELKDPESESSLCSLRSLRFKDLNPETKNRKERKELKDPESKSSLRSPMSNLQCPISLPSASAYSKIRAWTVLCSVGKDMNPTSQILRAIHSKGIR